MAATPKWKVFDSHGKYQASCAEVEGAAALMAFYGNGSTIRLGHNRSDTVWTEGADGHSAESYDMVAEVCHERESSGARQY